MPWCDCSLQAVSSAPAALVPADMRLPYETAWVHLQMQIVDPQAANPGYGRFELVADADHVNVCKPAHRKHMAYRLTKSLILDVVRASGRQIDGQDESEESLYQA